MIDEKVLAELERLEKAASPGPWVQCCPNGKGCGGFYVWRDPECLRMLFTGARGGLDKDPPVDGIDRMDAALIALLRTHAAALIAEARAAKVLREEVRAWRQVHDCDPMVRGECMREAFARQRATDSAGALGGDC